MAGQVITGPKTLHHSYPHIHTPYYFSFFSFFFSLSLGESLRGGVFFFVFSLRVGLT